MDSVYTIKVKTANIEIEVSGCEKDFVSTKFGEIMELMEDPTYYQKNKDSPEPESGHEQPTITNNGFKSNYGRERLAEEADVSIEALTNVYDFSKGIYIHKCLTGTDVVKQRMAAKLAIIAYELVQGQAEVSSKTLGRHMSELGISGTNHLAENIDSDGGFIRRGRSYKLNANGRKDALQLVKSLSS